MYTAGAALSSFAERERGSIIPGRLADLVVLSDDPTACPPLELLALRPEMTVVGGRVAWSSVKEW
jgi:predicted amidohydrolase YtcJ